MWEGNNPQQSEIDFVEALEVRNKKVYQVWELKAKHNKEPLDEARWKIVVEQVQKIWLDKGIDVDLVKAVWDAIHEVSLKIESLVPPVSENEQSNKEQEYQDTLLPIRKEIDALNIRLLDCIVWMKWEKDETQLQTEILSLIENTGKKNIYEYLECRIPDSLEQDRDFADICSIFKKVLDLSDLEILTIFGVSGMLFEKWSSGSAIPWEEKINQTLENMKEYILQK